MPPLPSRIVDAHHHLWNLAAVHYPWLMEKGVRRFFGDPTPIQRNYLPADFRADWAGLPVLKSVHIQVGAAPEDSVNETLWLQAQSDVTGLPTAIVAFCDLAAPDVAAQLDRHAAAPALRGIRQIVGRSAEEDARTGTGALLDNPQFATGLRELARRGLRFDLQLVPQQMAAAAELFAAVPELPVALCHAGSLSDRSADGFSLWRKGVERLAELPHLICKISGIGMFDNLWTAQTARPMFDVLLDHFGPSRIAFGSNFPVDSLYSDYASIWTRFAELSCDLSESERASLFAGTAERFYRI